MKRLFIIISAVLFLTTVVNSNAQNRCVLKSGNDSQTIITYSEGMKAYQFDDQSFCLVTRPEIKQQAKDLKETHILTVYPPTDPEQECEEILISDGYDLVDFFFQGMGDYLESELVDGIYYVVASGRLNEGENSYSCYWVLDSIELYNDTEVHVDFSECTRDLSVEYYDENGTSFSDLSFIDVHYFASLNWLGDLVQFKHGVWTGDVYYENIPMVRYNAFGDNNIFELTTYLEMANQKSYVLSNTQHGMHESPVFTVLPEDLNVFQEMFHVRSNPDSSPAYYHTERFEAMNDQGAWYFQEGWNINLTFDPEQPYTVVCNDKVGDPISYEAGPQAILFPTIHEWYDIHGLYNNPKYLDYFRTKLYFNNNNDVVREAAPFFKDALLYSQNPASWPNFYPQTPAKTVMPSDKMTYFGERTPLAHYYPMAFNASNTPMNQTFFKGCFFFSGEQSSDRTCDNDSFIRVSKDGQEIYADSIFRFNANNNHNFQLDPAVITVDVQNIHLVANDVLKSNRTRVEFDLNKDDAIPPTMTFLRVLNDNGDESIWLNDLSQSSLVFACADFDYYFSEEIGTYRYLVYQAKPEVEVYYSIEGEDWEPLVFEEDANLFHIDYGNVFVADLSQIERKVLNKWVSLRFSLTDEAGNTQAQILENVFFAGPMTAVNESSDGTLAHQTHPNPFTDEVKITTTQAVEGQATISVYDVLGKQVSRQTVNCAETKDFTIDGSTLKSGIYYYHIKTTDGVLQGKIVKE